MGLLKEILDKIDVHQEPVYLDSSTLIQEHYQKAHQKVKDEQSSVSINIMITINDDEDE